MDLPDFPADALDSPNHELGGLLLGYFIAAQAVDLGIPPDQIPEDFAEQVRQRILTLETATASNAALEKALHKAAAGDFEFAGKLTRELLSNGAAFMAALDEVTTGRRRQTKNARKSRPDALSALIVDIVEQKPDVTESELLAELRKHDRGSVIDDITEDRIFYSKNGYGGHSAPISGLKDRLSRLRKKRESR
jgi:hypothetical protein